MGIELLEVKSGPAKVIASGTVISFRGNQVDLTVGRFIGKFTVTLSFKDDPPVVGQSPALKVDFTVESPNSITVQFRNFSDVPLGAGNREPIKVASSARDDLYLSYRIYSLSGNADKLIHYAIYSIERPGNG